MKERSQTNHLQTRNLWRVGVFAIAMAYLESAVVVYLRRIYHINDLTRIISVFDPQVAIIEIGREVATLLMLWMIGWLSGKRVQSRLGFAIFAFGVWDIFYYIWLKIFLGWPASIMDMDLLDLIPLPWWGPVLVPILIATLLAIGGARVIKLDDQGITMRFTIPQLALSVCGCLIVLYTFMADAIALLPTDPKSLSVMTPTNFNWPVFMAGFILLVYLSWQTAKQTS